MSISGLRPDHMGSPTYEDAAEVYFHGLNALGSESEGWTPKDVVKSIINDIVTKKRITNDVALFEISNSESISVLAQTPTRLLPDTETLRTSLETTVLDYVTLNDDDSFSFKTTGNAENLIGFEASIDIKAQGNWSSSTTVALYREDPDTNEVTEICQAAGSTGNDPLLSLFSASRALEFYIESGELKNISDNLFFIKMTADTGQTINVGDLKLRLKMTVFEDIYTIEPSFVEIDEVKK